MHRSSAASADTNQDIDEMMLERFARMTIGQRARIAADLSEMCTSLALAGIRARHGALSDEDLRWHLARRRYGEALADEVYGPRNGR